MSRCLHFDRRTGKRCLRSWHLAGPHTYTLPNPIGARRARENVALALFRDEVRERAQGTCEAVGLVRPTGSYVCGNKPHPGSDPHHLYPEDRDAGRHDPERALFVCRAAHEFCHRFPQEAHELGLLRPDAETAV